MNDVHVSDKDSWSTEDSKELYLIDRWGSGYFDVDERGNMTIAPLQERGKRIAITDPDQRQAVLQHHRAARDFWQQKIATANAE